MCAGWSPIIISLKLILFGMTHLIISSKLIFLWYDSDNYFLKIKFFIGKILMIISLTLIFFGITSVIIWIIISMKLLFLWYDSVDYFLVINFSLV